MSSIGHWIPHNCRFYLLNKPLFTYLIQITCRGSWEMSVCDPTWPCGPRHSHPPSNRGRYTPSMEANGQNTHGNLSLLKSMVSGSRLLIFKCRYYNKLMGIFFLVSAWPEESPHQSASYIRAPIRLVHRRQRGVRLHPVRYTAGFSFQYF